MRSIPTSLVTPSPNLRFDAATYTIIAHLLIFLTHLHVKDRVSRPQKRIPSGLGPLE